MGRINSRSKGSKNERDVCKWWKEWTGYDFTRVPSSGGLRWNRTFDTTGDIVCADNKHALKFQFSIECKNYKDINFEHILLGTKSCKTVSFWKQALEDAKRGNKVPILMMRYNGMPKGEYFFCVDSDTLLDISAARTTKEHLQLMQISTSNMDINVLMASDIIKNTSYKVFHKLTKKSRR